MPAQGEYSAEPQLVPARMLNELVYCQRLVHLAWVDPRRDGSSFRADARAR